MTEYSIAKRAALLGSLITGLIGVIAAINALLDSEYVGAGICLIASSLAFIAIGYIFVRQSS